jgi:hypothetical protein
MYQKPSQKRYIFRPVFILTLLIVFFLPLDPEIEIATVASDSERIGYSHNLVDGVLVQSESKGIGVKLSDLMILMFFFFIVIMRRHLRQFVFDLDFRQYVFLLVFLAAGFLSLLINIESYSAKQEMILLLYLAKFAEITTIFIIVRYYLFLGYSYRTLIKVFLLSCGLLAVLSIVNKHYFLPGQLAFILPDRVQYTGIMALGSIVCLVYFFTDRETKRKVVGLSNFVVLFLFALLVFAVIDAGKRTTIFAMILIFPVLTVLIKRRYFVHVIVLSLLALIAISPYLSELLSRTILLDTNRPLWSGLAPHHAQIIKESALPGIIPWTLDYSTTERMAKWLQSMDLFFRNPIIGIGFWGAPYKYNFLPDSAYMQLLIDVGIIGTISFLIFFTSIWMKINSININPVKDFFGPIWKGGLILMALMGLSANVVYVFNLMAIIFIFSALAVDVCKVTKSEQLVLYNKIKA